MSALEDMILGKKLEWERCETELEALLTQSKAKEEQAQAAAATSTSNTEEISDNIDPPTTKIVRKSTNSKAGSSPKRKKKQASGWTSKISNYAKQLREKVDPALILGLTIENRSLIFFGAGAAMIYAYGDFLSV